MDSIFDWIMNTPNDTLTSKIITCNYDSDVGNEAISGGLMAGTFLLIGYRRDNYAHITAYSYWNNRAISIATIENGTWVKRFDRVITSSDLHIYGTLNGVTKIKNLPFGIYNLASADMRRLTDTPHELNGRSIIITTGDSTNDEKVALILSSHIGYGGVYFGYIWGNSVPEFSWKKIVENSN